MDFKLSEEQNLLIKSTKSFVKNELMQHEGLLEKTDNLPKELYQEIKKKSQELGLYACNMPTEYGGGGLNAFDLTLIEKELGHTSLALAEIAWRPQNILMACTGKLIDEYLEDPEYYLTDDVNEKRFYMRVIERGSSDEEPDDEGYRCIFVPFETKRVEDLGD